MASVCIAAAAAADTKEGAPLAPQRGQPPLPAFSYPAGSPARFSPYKLSIVHFWASWCAPCATEMPKFDAAAARYQKDGVQVIALSIDTNLKKAQDFLAKHHITHLQPALDPDTSVFHAAQGKALPTTLLVNSLGEPVARVDGQADWSPEGDVSAFIADYVKAAQ